MSRKPLIERTEGRRKGYKAHSSTIGQLVDADTLTKLNEIRGPVRRPKKQPRPHKG